MSLPINPAAARTAYLPAARPSAAPAPAATPAPQAPAPSATPPAAHAASTNGLEPAEQAMIDRYFPGSPAVALRLYGPAGQSQTVTPPTLGSRLDVRG